MALSQADNGSPFTCDADRAFFYDLYEKYSAVIYRFLLRNIGKDICLAEDLTQEVFLRALEHIEKLRKHPFPIGWLQTVARNLSHDHWRAATRAPAMEALEEESSHEYAAYGGEKLFGLDATLIDKDFSSKVHALFMSLPVRHRQAIGMWGYKNYTYQQAADRLGISVSAYGSLLYRAHTMFQKLIVSEILGLDTRFLTKADYAGLSKWIPTISEDALDSLRLKLKMSFEHDLPPRRSAHQAFHTRLDHAVVDMARLRPNFIVADFGMGTGELMCAVSSQVRAVEGFDYSAHMCHTARQNLSRGGVNNAVVHQTDIRQLEDDAPRYDVAFCKMVLHHTENPGLLIKKMAAVIQPGGRLILADLAKHNCHRLVTDRNDLWYGFDKKSLERFFRQAGFQRITIIINEKDSVAFEGTGTRICSIVAMGEK